MTSEHALNETWELTRPTMPARSRLYSLEPLGMGTHFTESLASYITRLAEAHSVSCQDLLRRELVPVVAAIMDSFPALYECPPHHSSMALESKKERDEQHLGFARGRVINGARNITNCWVKAVEQLTLRTGLHYLTLLPWPEVARVERFLKVNQSWCPACYEEWRAASQPIYEPLLWSLTPITVCLRHLQPLWQKCPRKDCHNSIVWFEEESKLGYCGACGSWLGLSAKEDPGEEHLPEPDDLIWISQLNEEYGKFIAAAPSLRLQVCWKSQRCPYFDFDVLLDAIAMAY